IVFATYPLLAGIDTANMIFNIVFFVSLTSVVIQGTTLSVVANWLNVGLPEEAKPLSPTDELLAENPKTIMEEIVIKAGAPVVGLKIVDLHFPKKAIIAMIEREGIFLTPDGSTELHALDKLVVLTDKKEILEEIYVALKIN
ncbi:MAG: TrkA C-terminal domain-containing protein, partial [Cyclobacteriaceae bacterium]